MTELITDKPSKWKDWLCEIINHLEEFDDIERMILVAEPNDEYGTQLIDFMNCNTDDMYYYGGVIQKEAIKHEMSIELGLEDDWEESEEEDE